MRTLLLALPLAGCFDKGTDEPMTLEEARHALEQSVSSARVESSSSEVVEISTSFTMGAALEEAAEELHDWFVSQMPCSTVTRDGATVTVDFGTLDDACVYDGHTYSGVLTLTVDATDAAELVVTHGWQDMTNGDLTLNGGATVAWSAADLTRHVEHDAVWDDGVRTLEGTGDRLQGLIDADQGLAGGIVVDGVRDWEVVASETDDPLGAWHLDIEDVQMRGQDPVPQAGSYVLLNPDGKDLTMQFERVDDDTIRVTLLGMREDHMFLVTATGEVEGEE